MVLHDKLGMRHVDHLAHGNVSTIMVSMPSSSLSAPAIHINLVFSCAPLFVLTRFFCARWSFLLIPSSESLNNITYISSINRHRLIPANERQNRQNRTQLHWIRRRNQTKKQWVAQVRKILDCKLSTIRCMWCLSTTKRGNNKRGRNHMVTYHARSIHCLSRKQL